MSLLHKQPIEGETIFVLPNFLSADECDRYIALSESAGYDEASITTRARGSFTRPRIARAGTNSGKRYALRSSRVERRRKLPVRRKGSARHGVLQPL